MQTNTLFDVEKNFKEAFEAQKKFIQSIDVLINLEDTESDKTPKEFFYREDKMKVFHYLPQAKKISKTPTLIIYALVNRQYMMDIQQDRSMIKNLLGLGQDLYIIDWGYPTAQDKYVTLDDYIDVYIDSAVDEILKSTGAEKLNIIGVCQGGTLSAIYTALNPRKVKNLVTMVTPIDFEAGRAAKDGFLFKWSKYMDVDNLVDAFGTVPGEFLNGGFDMLKPFQLMLNKYVGIVDNFSSVESAANFIRMEKWILDSPDQAGEAFRRFIKDMYQENRLVKGTLEIGGRTVNLNNITMPVLAVCGDQDHLVPPEATKPIMDLIGSSDKELVIYPVGHIGLYVSSKSQNLIAPKISDWLSKRDK